MPALILLQIHRITLLVQTSSFVLCFKGFSVSLWLSLAGNVPCTQEGSAAGVAIWALALIMHHNQTSFP